MRVLLLSLALTVSGVAVASPSVPNRLLEGLPAEAFQATATLDRQIAQLTETRDVKIAAIAAARSAARTAKLDIKAAKAQVKADKAARKAARKRGDVEGASAARVEQEASEARLAALETLERSSGALADLLEAQRDLVASQLALKEAERQVVLAEAVNAHVEPYSEDKLRAARAKADIAFQRARQDMSLAEARFSSRGGQNPPDAMIIDDFRAPSAPAAPASPAQE